MSASLVIASDTDSIELLDSASTDFMLAGIDFGGPQPDLTVIPNVLLDGDRITGQRSGNRDCHLPVDVHGTDALDVAGNVNRLVQIVDQETFTVTWAPNGGLPVVFDCYRGTSVRTRTNFLEDAFWTTVDLSFSAAPFGRSTTQQTITVASSTALDAFDNGTNLTGATYQTTTKYLGTGSASVTLTRNTTTLFSGSPMPVTGYYYTNSGVTRTFTAADWSSYSAFSVRFQWNAPDMGNTRPWEVTVSLRLKDNSNITSTVSQVVSLPSGTTRWYLLTWDASDFTGINMATVKETMFTVGNVADARIKTGTASTPGSTSTAYLDDLRGNPGGTTVITANSGTVVYIPTVKGTARAPFSGVFTLTGGGTFANPLIHRPPKEQDPDLGIITNLTAGAGTIAAANAKFDGTYTVVLILSSVGTGTRTVTVTFTQLAADGTTVLGTAVASTISTYTSGRLLVVDQVTLPIQKVPAEVAGSYTVAVASSGGTTDAWYAVALLDSRGQSVILNTTPTGTTKVYVDEPDPSTGLGQVYTSATDRSTAVNAMSLSSSVIAPSPLLDGGPLLLEPGSPNRLLLAVPNATLDATLTYLPRWQDERTD